jgi:hypothetical protein
MTDQWWMEEARACAGISTKQLISQLKVPEEYKRVPVKHIPVKSPALVRAELALERIQHALCAKRERVEFLRQKSAAAAATEAKSSGRKSSGRPGLSEESGGGGGGRATLPAQAGAPPEAPAAAAPTDVKEKVCAICRDNVSNGDCFLECFDRFHSKCIKKWLRTQRHKEFRPSCPVCLKRVSKRLTDSILGV